MIIWFDLCEFVFVFVRIWNRSLFIIWSFLSLKQWFIAGMFFESLDFTCRFTIIPSSINAKNNILKDVNVVHIFANRPAAYYIFNDAYLKMYWLISGTQRVCNFGRGCHPKLFLKVKPNLWILKVLSLVIVFHV